jgi:5,10-methylenetetrahydromethanopterin reductase
MIMKGLISIDATMPMVDPGLRPGSRQMRLGLALANEGALDATAALARQAEDLGLAEVWVPESLHGRSATSAVATLAARTERIGLGVGVVNPFWRHPSLIAMEAATLDEASGGRLRIGLGAGLWTLQALGEADQRTRRPLVAMVEAIGIVRAMLAGERGPNPQVFVVRPDAALSFEPLRRHIPLYVGAVNRRMLEASGALADGVYLGAITSPGYVAWAGHHVRTGAAGAARDPASVDLVANVLTSVARDPRAARAAVRSVLAYYTASRAWSSMLRVPILTRSRTCAARSPTAAWRPAPRGSVTT